jgi:hypothetical protein
MHVVVVGRDRHLVYAQSHELRYNNGTFAKPAAPFTIHTEVPHVDYTIIISYASLHLAAAATSVSKVKRGRVSVRGFSPRPSS